MPHYRSAGSVPAKRHTRAEGPDGRPLFEELIGTEGFAAESSLLYHRCSPSALCDIRALAIDGPVATADRPVTPRHLRTGGLPVSGDPVRGRILLLANDDVRISWVSATDDGPLTRDAVGDQLVYVQSGAAGLESPFGRLGVGAGDYVVVPRGVTSRWVLESPQFEALVVEATGHVAIPAKYLSERGQMIEGAPFCERDLRGPTGPLDLGSPTGSGSDAPGPVDVLVRNRGGWSVLAHAHHPFDVVGWDGCVYPYALGVADFEPIVGAVHQPPPVHQTFAGQGFVVCTFVPRPLDFGEGAAKVPYHHSNVDSDEVLFYSSGDFTSRTGSGVGVGSITFHPSGFVHGPQPGSAEAARDQDRTDEVAVMIDTFHPLGLTAAARAVADADYPWTWSR